MLKRSIGIVVVAAAGACALAMPAGAKQDGGNRGQAVRVAAATCKQERKDLGRQKFGEEDGKHAMKTCISEAPAEAKTAAQECRAERGEMGLDKFREEYGTNHNGRNAFGKCVSEHVNGDDEEPACDSQQPGDEDDGSADGGAADDGSADDGTTD